MNPPLRLLPALIESPFKESQISQHAHACEHTHTHTFRLLAFERRDLSPREFVANLLTESAKCLRFCLAYSQAKAAVLLLCLVPRMRLKVFKQPENSSVLFVKYEQKSLSTDEKSQKVSLFEKLLCVFGAAHCGRNVFWDRRAFWHEFQPT